MTINIIQGISALPPAQVNIIIDVIRAFSVSYYAFENGINEIILVGESDDALALKELNPDYLLSGEIGGLKIEGFDFGNSPHEISEAFLKGKTLIQRTTNGVKAALNALDAKHVFVTGFANAYETALQSRKFLDSLSDKFCIVNIIASHPDGDDDLACAEFIKNFILNPDDDVLKWNEQTAFRILGSSAAQKFLNKDNQDFPVIDLLMCSIPKKSNFVMQVNSDTISTKIKKRFINV